MNVGLFTWQRGPRSTLPVATLLIALAGCATPRLHGLAPAGSAALPPRAELESVPFHPQEEYQCGPAALATALGAAGFDADPDALRPQVYVPGRMGSFQVEMLAAARRNGAVAVELKPDLASVFAEVAAGSPVVVLQNLGLGFSPVWHYAVVAGYDLDSGKVTLRSGTTRRLEMPLAAFERTWERAGRWAMLALPPQRLPASLDIEQYLAFVIKLERSGPPQAARAAYESILGRAPGNVVALLGLGNTAYVQGDFASAERAFREAVRVQPDSAAARNNLAEALAALGRYPEALSEAKTAVSLGGPLGEVAARTLQAVAARAGQQGQASAH